ncbi:uncharacterized protein LOC124124878 isoform X2 [Haliotis rufescens]|uniref:uncharacterized protein LOC124124878 isoform X2 n=1 Tax=Haliotis rufescens TaxID=6454 RepID=UPI001EB07233|nr:uncharacterized protein LOC124124878 isoform X2 [Haliotis rufescens]
MTPMNSSRIGAFFVCVALITTRGFAAYIPQVEVSQQSSHVLKRAGLRLMCQAHPRNCPDGFRKRNYVQNIETPSSHESPESIVKQLQDIINWRHRVMRRKMMAESQSDRIFDMIKARSLSRRK